MDSKKVPIIALAASKHATRSYGPLHCVGSFNHAINFLTSDEQLLTLHRDGKGISPMGWLIDSNGFDEVSLRLANNNRCRFSVRGIGIGHLIIKMPEQRLDLTLMTTEAACWPMLFNELCKITAATGLFGKLNQVINAPLSAELNELVARFSCWLAGECIDWSGVVGKGPGLTPSYDDMFLGMLFVAALSKCVSGVQLQAFFHHSQQLNQLTTQVSASYLRYASQGIFATPLHQLAQGLVKPEQLSAVINSFQHLGHFSGADTLLGVYLAGKALGYFL